MSSRILTKQEINRFLTDLCNGYHVTLKQQKFLEKAIRINLNEHRYFCVADYTELSSVSFRQYVHKSKEFLVVGTKSNPCFYRIKGTPELSTGRPVTDRPMGDKMIQILEHVREQPASIHDIKLQTFSENFHEILVRQGEKIHPNNNGILLPKLQFDVNVFSKIHVYPRTISVDIACTHQPLVYDIVGIVQLTSLLGQIYRHLQILSKFEAQFPPVGEWIVKMYHAGKDGTQSFSGESYEVRYDELTGGTIRYYNKLWNDGTRKPRFERIITPNVTLVNEIDRLLTDKYLQQS